MKNPEPNSRLNVPIKLVAQPTGDFALSGADGAHSVAAEGVAIRGVTGAGSGGAVAAVSQLVNLDVPTGELAGAAGVPVKATDELSFSTTELASGHEGIAVPGATVAATGEGGLNVGTPKFTY